MKATMQKINERAASLGFNLWRGNEGGIYYYWFNIQDDDGTYLGGDLKETIVYCTCRLSDMTLDEWIADLEDKINEAKEDEFHFYKKEDER